ncbi:FUSC family protein [Kytococcus sedentarius]|uniref:FUSC family protein n=1 Tax=Kytococcus sedentarius TaxID=1276 RepID=UPI0035BC8170
MNPHRYDHLVAIRAGLSVLIALGAVVLTGHTEWAAYAAFGVMTSLYGRHHHWAQRAGLQASAALALCTAVCLGVLVSGQELTPWWVVLGGGLVAAGGTVVSTAFGWHPPGPLFLVFGFSVCALAAPGPQDLPVAAAVSVGAALVALVIGHVGWLREPATWRVPDLPLPRLRQVLGRADVRVDVATFLLATWVAGGLGMLVAGDHAYWAMVAASAGLVAASRRGRVVRALHRIIGTLAGVLVAGVVLAGHPQGMVLVLVIAALQVGAELLVGRNYSLALLAITPMALAMGQLISPAPLTPLLADRALETVVGAGVALAVVWIGSALRPTAVRPAPG